jgi:hypothetical protein
MIFSDPVVANHGRAIAMLAVTLYSKTFLFLSFHDPLFLAKSVTFFGTEVK